MGKALTNPLQWPPRDHITPAFFNLMRTFHRHPVSALLTGLDAPDVRTRCSVGTDSSDPKCTHELIAARLHLIQFPLHPCVVLALLRFITHGYCHCGVSPHSRATASHGCWLLCPKIVSPRAPCLRPPTHPSLFRHFPSRPAFFTRVFAARTASEVLGAIGWITIVVHVDDCIGHQIVSLFG